MLFVEWQVLYAESSEWRERCFVRMDIDLIVMDNVDSVKNV